MKPILFIIFLLVFSASAYESYSQTNISVRATGIAIHPFTNDNIALYKNKLTGNGSVCFEPGLQFSAELFGTAATSFKFVQGIQNDAAAKLSGTTQIMFRIRILHLWKNFVHIGIGPAFHYRQTWTQFPEYEQEDMWETNSKMDVNKSWISGEIEYNYYFSKNSDLSFSINHSQPQGFSLFLGYKYWLSRKSNRCNTCPGLK